MSKKLARTLWRLWHCFLAAIVMVDPVVGQGAAPVTLPEGTAKPRSR